MTKMIWRVEVVNTLPEATPKERSLFSKVRASGFWGVQAIRTATLYFLSGALDAASVQRLVEVLLHDPVVEKATWQRYPPKGAPNYSIKLPPYLIDVALLPGVTDSTVENLLRAAHIIGVEGLTQAATVHRYRLWGDLTTEDLQQIAGEIIANPTIQRFSINQPLPPTFIKKQQPDGTAAVVPLIRANRSGLLAISKKRRLALNLDEMLAIQAYFRQEGRDPTDLELETLAQTWSEHCVHKTFKAKIHYRGPVGEEKEQRELEIDGLLETYIQAATEKLAKPWVHSAFVDNAGIIAFDDEFDIAFKVETHNHPSALEPFGGANTGVGGVVRDIIGVSARPIANTDYLFFGPEDATEVPAGVLHPRRIAQGVTAGIEDYGNKMGIPTVNGSVFYDPGYIANPLVYAGCIGILPRGKHRSLHEARHGDLIVLIGGRTGRDGLRGATFSSMGIDHLTAETAGSAVQIGNPIYEKQVLEVVIEARDQGLYDAITDCGAGGLSSAVGEMGARIGAEVQLADVPLKYTGLRPWEIWLSEAQERMVLAVPPEKWQRFLDICRELSVEAVTIGSYGLIEEGVPRLRVRYNEKVVADLAMPFLHSGLPRRRLEAFWQPLERPNDSKERSAEPAAQSLSEALLALLNHPNIRSKEAIVRRYDHEVQAGTVVKPFVGASSIGPSDAAVLVPLEVHRRRSNENPVPGVALAGGFNPRLTSLDPYAMAWAAVDEAVRNLVAVGADPERIAILDNFSWGNPNRPEQLGALVRAVQGCHDAAIAYGTPFISGKDSLNNEYTGPDGEAKPIPGTLVISAIGLVPNVRRTITMDLKSPSNLLYIVGETRPELGRSHYDPHGSVPPRPDHRTPGAAKALHRAIRAGIVQAVHDCSEGGIGVAAAEMAIGGQCGLSLSLPAIPVSGTESPDEILFSESLGRWLVEIRPEDRGTFESLLSGTAPTAPIGEVRSDKRFLITGEGEKPLIDLSLDKITTAWRGEKPEEIVVKAEPSCREYTPAPTTLAPPRVLILNVPGTNRDREVAWACEMAGGDPEIVHITQLLSGERRLEDYQMLILAGGFAYGDDLGAGKLTALDLRYRIEEPLMRFIESGKPVLGICNGFQALVKSGLLPDVDPDAAHRVTLTHNLSGHFECRWVHLRPDPASPCIWTQGIEGTITCPVAHAEGRFIAESPEVITALQTNQQIALTYVNPSGELADYPWNPNGSQANVAGICNKAGNVLGLMPHPEDHIVPEQHPRFHRGGRGGLGLILFQNGIRYSWSA